MNHYSGNHENDTRTIIQGLHDVLRKLNDLEYTVRQIQQAQKR